MAERPHLTETHMLNRFNWSKEHWHWTIEQWRKYIWLDECFIEKVMDLQQMWVFQDPGNSEKFKPKNVKPKNKCNGISVMIWSCFASNLQGPLAVCYGHRKAV